MSTAHVPQQSQPPQPSQSASASEAPPPTPPHASEATRLLCAGAYLDSGYRDRVIGELHLNEQRIVAPSLGFDAARVLAHALRARRQELLWAGTIIGLWMVGTPLSGGLLGVLLWASIWLALAPWIRGRAAQPPLYRLLPAFLARWWGRLLFAVMLVVTLVVAFGGGPDTGSSASSYDSYDPSSGYGSSAPDDFDFTDVLLPTGKPWQAWVTLVVLVLIGLCVHAQRSQVSRALAAELSPERFPDAAGDPAEQAENPRFQRLKQRIRLEQHAPLIMYNEAHPFCGAGAAYDTWVLAVELKPDELKKKQQLSNRTILEKVRPLLEQLRIPAEFAGNGVRDRLRWLEVDECVFLPAEGLLRRDQAPYTPQAFEEHRARAVEEGAEKRRHFLRIRVGGWEEELVVTVFVRVHTQGRMLMLEIAPHVLTPVRPDFKEADRMAHRFRHNTALGKAAAAAVLVPGSLGRALGQLGRGLVYVWRVATGGYAGALPDGPALSVRELGSAPTGSLFQEMDVARYLKNVQDRVANGVRAALAESGYETGEFVQKVVNISNGDVNIGRVEGSTFAVGSHASAASSTVGGAAPQKGADSDVR
ncbi:hypothetical protein [Streptomyces sp. V3I7]|uniref:hypothetical protein n=1 Tax=Streptomyces sp. V3I7 TaxID=3042278 RepID=UPI0027871CB2|nr:hypothetical protein [Streptomyces sp. V3I7]MDQ0992594.1 hypothetical protein [Streptomyces sp. V3I7]